MKQAVLLSIQPKWVRLIASGEKIVEIRKTRPKLETPFKCYIYCTKGIGWYGVQSKANPAKRSNALGTVVGEFICDICAEFTQDYYELALASDGGCVPIDELKAYLGAANRNGYVWHISELKMYDKPKPLSDFNSICAKKFCADKCKHSSICDYYGRRKLERAPQSYCFVEELP